MNKVNNEEKNIVRVAEVHKSQYVVMTKDGAKRGALSGKLLYKEEYPLVGDYVEIVPMSDSEVLIVSIQERKSVISRPNNSGHADGYVKNIKMQEMVANVDYCFVVSSLNDNFNLNRIARYASLVREGGVIPIIVLTKADLCNDTEKYLGEVHEMIKDTKVFAISSYTGEGIEELKSVVKPGLTITFLGSSGVGKSTLMNILIGEETMKTGEIREKDSKGRHVTTHRQMVEINGTYFVDTPGMRELGMCDVTEGIDETFEDIVTLMSCCKFSNCSHGTEPGCAITRAIEDGTLLEERWKTYVNLSKENVRAKEMKAKKMIEISKQRKMIKKKR